MYAFPSKTLRYIRCSSRFSSLKPLSQSLTAHPNEDCLPDGILSRTSARLPWPGTPLSSLLFPPPPYLSSLVSSAAGIVSPTAGSWEPLCGGELPNLFMAAHPATSGRLRICTVASSVSGETSREPLRDGSLDVRFVFCPVLQNVPSFLWWLFFFPLRDIMPSDGPRFRWLFLLVSRSYSFLF